MSEHYPDRWVVVKDGRNGDHRILGSWFGGYIDGDYWRLSSGVVEVTEKDDWYVVENYSGSLYFCRKNGEGMSTLSAGVLKQYSDALDLQEHGEQVLKGYIK